MNIRKNNFISWLLILALLSMGLSDPYNFHVSAVDEDDTPSTIIVDSNGTSEYTSIQKAINSAKTGDTIRILPGEYHENIQIDKGITILGSGPENTVIIGEYQKIVDISSSWVNISGLTITGEYEPNSRYTGLSTDEVDHTDIQNINFTDLNVGIYIRGSNNSIRNNEFFNTSDGIIITYSKSDTIMNNKINSKNNGIKLGRSESISLYNNKFIECGMIIHGSSPIYWTSHSIDKTNTIDNKPIYYFKNIIGGEIPMDGGEIILANCSKVAIENRSVKKTQGIVIGFSNNITLRNITFAENKNCIQIQNSEDNSIMANRLINNINGLISIANSYNNTIERNNISMNLGSGITIDNSHNNTIINNTFIENYYNQIYLVASNYNFVKNNILSQNNYTYINTHMSYYNQIINNTMNSSGHSSINIYNCISETLKYNRLNSGGIQLYAYPPETEKFWTSHIIENNTVNGKPIIYWKNITAGKVPLGAGQVILANCSRVIIEDQNCSNATLGILIGISNNITIQNNICNSNMYGISLYNSDSNYLINNTCNFNIDSAIQITSSDSNRIYDNSIYSPIPKYSFLYITNSRSNVLYNNRLISSGISVGGDLLDLETHIIAPNNTVNNKPIYYWTSVFDNAIPPGAGQIFLINCSNVTVENQNCSNISYSLNIKLSKNIKIINNSFNSSYYGILIDGSSYCYIYNNIISNNYIGISLSGSEKNIIKHNNISNNIRGGISIYNSNNNKIVENIISYNSEYGLSIDSRNTNNLIYHNNFISNKLQAKDKRTNSYWHYYGEGNYWSDYNGSDIGGYGGIPGDNIGDTSVPHLGLDPYPYISPSGWLLPIENQSKESNYPDADDDTLDSVEERTHDDSNFMWYGLIILICIIIVILILFLRARGRAKRVAHTKKRSVKKKKVKVSPD